MRINQCLAEIQDSGALYQHLFHDKVLLKEEETIIRKNQTRAQPYITSPVTNQSYTP